MASAVHIPFDELPAAARELLERAGENGELFIDGPGTGFKISKLPGRTVADILADPSIKWSGATVDEAWSKDLEDIIASRKLDRDPWAE